jgi:LIVCS family branched-chain amino acid:cation transporter|tara:strand:+ start:730 stop:2025 length:1296 start_codon:yes stop_codon:yes gene_type:complete
MDNTKKTFIVGFALFSMFFGAGNLLLPPLLGYNAGKGWFLVAIGFVITAVIIPILGILAHAKLQGTMYDFGKKVSPFFSRVYCVLIYIIAIAIPSPRTASATHEIAIHPFFGTSSLLTSSIYFSLVLIFALNRSKIISLIGKFLTPLIVLILLSVIGIALFSTNFDLNPSQFEVPLVSGILEGYQTFDAIGAVVVGAVLIISLKHYDTTTQSIRKEVIAKAGLIAGIGLFIIYAGLISVGAYYSQEISIDLTQSSDMQRSTLLRGITIATLGNIGNAFLSVLISLACFTTAVSIIVGSADYFKGLFENKKHVYTITAIIGSVVGVIIGQLNFHTIVMIALPILMLIYPITIVLILLNNLPEKHASKSVFRAVVLATFIFSIPDFLKFIVPVESLQGIQELIPFSQNSLGWVIPAILTFVLVNAIKVSKSKV